MHNLLLHGAGKLGTLISFLLSQSNTYLLPLPDIQAVTPFKSRLGHLQNCKYSRLDANNKEKVAEFIKQNKINAIISSLPFYCNKPIAEVAASHDLHYFDLTEDVETTKTVEELS